MTLTAAADGSALGNPGPAGWAWYIDDDRWAAGGWSRGTNNMGELRAVLELFRATEGVADDLLVLCDSRYVIDSITKWMPGWKRKGWRKADGQPVLNVDLMQQLDAALAGRDYRFEWIKGHAGHPLNEAADERARGAATAYQRGVAPDSGPGFGGTPTPAVGGASPAAASAPSGSAAPALFDADPEDDRVLTLRLGANEWRRLRSLADAAGTSPEDAVRALIRRR